MSALLIACSGRVVVGTDRGGTSGAGGKLVGTAGASAGQSSAGATANGGGDTSGGSTFEPAGAGGVATSGGRTSPDGGVAGAVQGGSAGTANEGGAAQGGAAQGGTGGIVEQAGASGEGGGALPPRWIAVDTMFSSASSRTAVSFQNLSEANSELIVYENDAGAQCRFSPDGSVACFVRRIDSTKMEAFVMDASASVLGSPLSLGVFARTTGFTWSPDSKRLIAVDSLNFPGEVLYLDPSSGKRESFGASQGSVTFARDGSLFFTNADGALIRVQWSSDGPRAAATGITGALGQLSSARDVAVLSPLDSESSGPRELVNLETLAHAPLPPLAAWSLSPSFGTLVSIDMGAAVTSGGVLSTFSYYRVQNVSAELVESQARVLSVDDIRAIAGSWLKFAGERFVELRNGRVFLSDVDARGVTSWELDAEYQVINGTAWSPDGRWGTVTAKAIGSDTSDWFQWLFRVDDMGARWITKLGPFGAGSDTYFSPDSSKLVVAGYDAALESMTAQPAMLLTLDASAVSQTRDLALPYNWANGVWSSDSSYIAFIGGAYALKSRPLYVVDANDHEVPNRLIVSCSSNPAPDPGCPMEVMFQR